MMNISSNITKSDQTLRDNIQQIIFSYLTWLTLSFIAGWISKRIIPKVKLMTEKEQMFWQLAIVRTIFGIPLLWGGYILFIDKRLSVDHIFATIDESNKLISICTGFFIFEELALIYSDIKYGSFSKELHIHHFFTLNGFFNTIYYNLGHYYAIKIFILQISTPFTCICWCLLKLKLENTKAWKINQWILIYIFHSRSFYEIYCWYGFYQDWIYIKENLPLILIINMFTGLAILTLWLTPYWTYRKTIQYFYPNYWYTEKKIS